jgi:hypothetical protein
VTARGAASLGTVADPRNDPSLQAWLPKAAVTSAPPLMGVRDLGAGRLGVLPMRDHWLFAPPPRCPPVEAMLKHDDPAHPSDWLLVCANAMRWLAEPSLKAGFGGATTAPALLDPPVQAWDIPPTNDWSRIPPLEKEPDLPQNAGLVGARTKLSSGSGTVADYAAAARAAGLRFIVFLEDSLHMDQAGWDQLVKECAAASDDAFVAVPGLTYEDAQGNHLYVFGDKVLFPKPAMLLPDKRLNTAKSNRCDMYFQYVNELVGQTALTGFWRHRQNPLHWRDYKLYNSFPLVSFEDGQPVDEDALPEYLDWMGMGGCQAVLAFEIMTKPEFVAARATNGWRVVWNRDLKDLRTGQWHRGAYSFSGMGAQYITSGPSVLLWSTPQNLVGANGLWWRPDLWEFRLRLRVASEAGLRSVVLHDGNRQVLRRWLPGGAKRFEQELVLANAQQFGLTLVAEDVHGGRAVTTGYWNRNLNQEEFFCSDRCNILGSARLRLKKNGTQYWTPVGFQGNMGCTPSKGRMDLFVQPAVGLTANSPTIPVDGQPLGLPPVTVNLFPQVPGEYPTLFTTPSTYLAGPELVVGQYGFELAYDPAEEKATNSPLGHAYEQPQYGSGNSWSSWHRLIPTRRLSGWARLHACNWLTEGFRVGWLQTHATLKEPVALAGKGIAVGYTKGIVYREGKALSGPGLAPTNGPFARGTYACMESEAGAVVLVGMSEAVGFRASGTDLQFFYRPGVEELPAGAPVDYTIAFAGADGRTPLAGMLAFAEAFGLATPGTPAYKADVRRGKLLDTYLTLSLAAENGATEVRLPKTALPGFLTTTVEGLNDRWSVHLLDRARKGWNYRALPIRDGRAFAQLDLNDAALDVFIGHPVTATDPNLRLTVAWKQPGVWQIEAHNPTDAPIRAALESQKGWTPFRFRQAVDLAPGASAVWTAEEK